MSISISLPLKVCLCAIFISSCLSSTALGQQRRGDAGWPCKGTVDPAYVRSAEATGGVVMLFKPTELAGAAAERRASDRHDEVVFRASGQLARGDYEFEVPLDPAIESAYFFMSMQCLEGVTLIRPAGDAQRTDEAGIEYHHFEAVRLFTVPQPAPGAWKVRVAGSGYFTVLVKADTDVKLSGVTFSAGLPLQRGPQQLEVRMTGVINDIAVHFLSASAAILETLALRREEESDGARRYAGEVTPPARDFRVAVTGVDDKGFRVQRVGKRLYVD